MAINLSLWDGIPLNIEVAKRQFESLILSELERTLSRGKYLVLKINEEESTKNILQHGFMKTNQKLNI